MPLGLLAAILWAGHQTRLERRAELSAQSASLAASVSASLDQYLYAFGATLAQHDAVRALDAVGSQRLFASVLREQPSISNVALLALIVGAVDDAESRAQASARHVRDDDDDDGDVAARGTRPGAAAGRA